MQTNESTIRRLAVLKIIRQAGAISRSELPALSGLSGSTITEVSAELLSRALIRETKETTKRNGRPRVLLEINDRGSFVIGADLAGQNRLISAIVDLTGAQKFAMDVELPQAACLNELAHNIAVGVERVLDASPYSAGEIAVVGIGIPALLDSRSGVVHQMTAFSEPPVPFAEIISRHLGLPVTIENEAACMARTEHWFGRAQELDTFTLVHVGAAVRSAEYINGIPKVGVNGFTSEIGHSKVAIGADAFPCVCGSRGCLTTYCSINGIVAQAGELGGEKFLLPEFLPDKFYPIVRRAEAGDPRAQGLFERAGHHLGTALSNYLNVFDPGNILLVFSDLTFFELMRPAFENALAENALAPVLKHTNIEVVAETPNWRLAGTAALALEHAYLGAEADGASRHPSGEGSFFISAGRMRPRGMKAT